MADEQRKNLQTTTSVRRSQVETAADIEMDRATTESDIANAKKQAEAKPEPATAE